MEIKGKKIGLGIITGAIVLSAIITALAAVVVPFLTIVVIINMIYNKGSINFSPKKAPRPIIKRERFEKLKI